MKEGEIPRGISAMDTMEGLTCFSITNPLPKTSIYSGLARVKLETFGG